MLKEITLTFALSMVFDVLQPWRLNNLQIGIILTDIISHHFPPGQ